jgi:hypothetical protein
VTQADLASWVQRANRARATLASYGIPVHLTVAFEGDAAASLEVKMGPLATIALLEMLAEDIERHMQEDEDERDARYAHLRDMPEA